MIGTIILIILILGLLFFTIYLIVQDLKLKKTFEKHNVAIFGAKGKGKDLLTQLVIKLRNRPYISNIDYGGFRIKDLKLYDLNTYPNTFIKLINNEITKIKKVENMEDIDIYISDTGIYLPSQYDIDLSNKFGTLPIYYALSRHLYNQNIHFNTQALNRVWIKLREQADYYILCRGILKLPGLILINITYYDCYEAAENKQRPAPKRFLNPNSTAERDIYNSTYGEIINSIVAIPISWIKYDTREFHNKLFGYKAPNKKESKEINKGYKEQWKQEQKLRKTEIKSEK